MGSELLVDESFPIENENRGKVGKSSPFLLTETFEKHFPYYLAMGMTYEQYWYKDCTIVKYYRDAEKIRVRKKNEEAWWQGLYIYEALACVSPIFNPYAKKGTKPVPYREKPYDLDLKTNAEKVEKKESDNKVVHDKGMALMLQLMGDVNKKFKEKGGKVDE